MNMADKPQQDYSIKQIRRPQSLSVQVATELEQRIESGAIGVGENLPSENALCALFGVSRTVVREAVNQLKSLGLVESRRGVGTTVVSQCAKETLFTHTIDPRDTDDILHILELRLSLEPKAAELAALRHDDTDRARFEACMAAFEKMRGEDSLARQEDFEFHAALAAASKNPYFRQLYQQLDKNVIPRAKVVGVNLDREATEAYLDRVHADHAAIVSAVLGRRPEAAAKAMHDHLYRAWHLYKNYAGSAGDSCPDGTGVAK